MTHELDDEVRDAGLDEALQLLAEADYEIERAQSNGEDHYPFREED